MLGREVATLVNGELRAGVHQGTFSADGLASGIYIYRLATKGFVQSRKMAVAK
jgi:hypothetical protein